MLCDTPLRDQHINLSVTGSKQDKDEEDQRQFMPEPTDKFRSRHSPTLPHISNIIIRVSNQTSRPENKSLN
ncbi:hypothetical protein Plhal304r1_c043g0123121 [Plasmopara halstedii]